MRPRIAELCGLLLALAAPAAPAAAQNSAAISGTVTITPSLAITGVRDMNFGTLPQGINNVYIGDPSIDARAGLLRVTAPSGFAVVLTFQLPPDLSDGAGHAIPLTEWFGAFVAQGLGTTNFTPNPLSVSNASIGNDGVLDVYLGARLGLDANQFPATYSGVIVVNCFYN